MLDVTCTKPLSWYWQSLIGLALILALGSIFFCIWRQALPVWFGVLLSFSLILYFYQQAMLLCWRKKPRAVIGLQFSTNNELTMLCQNGQRYSAQLDSNAIVLSSLTLLKLKAKTFKTRVLIEAGAVSPEDYRTLARKVREIQNVQV